MGATSLSRARQAPEAIQGGVLPVSLPGSRFGPQAYPRKARRGAFLVFLAEPGAQKSAASDLDLHVPVSFLRGQRSFFRDGGNDYRTQGKHD